MRISRRRFLLSSASGAGAALIEHPVAALVPGALTPERFGAKGDGRTDDTEAFVRLSAAVNKAGGGAITLRRTTYIVGRQTKNAIGASYGYEPSTILEIAGCTRPVTIRGNGARLRCAPGLRYGTFDPASDAPTRHPPMGAPMRELATPYRAMISISRCTAPVTIADVELDGDLPTWRIGGPFGDTGYQVPATGLLLIDNSGGETVRNLWAHHHGQDGIMIRGADEGVARSGTNVLDRVRCEHNGRQGLSFVGGSRYAFTACRFAHTGDAAVFSPPGAGVDLEAEGGRHVHDLRFDGCTFENNAGCGMVADTGPTRDVRFTTCTFVGSRNWAAWPNKPGFRFERCTFVGPIVRAFSSTNPADQTAFHACTFTDDVRLSPTGKLYGGTNTTKPIADLSDEHVLFDGCSFVLTGDFVLPWSTNATYRDCFMTQRKHELAFPRGLFQGRNVITGPVNIGYSKVGPGLVINGKPVTPNVS